MSERYDREERSRGETDERLGPNIDAEGRRMNDPRGSDGPRPVKEARTERKPRGESHEERGQQGAHRRGDADDRGADAEGRGTSWLSVIFGWLSALGAGLILSGIVGAVVGAIFGAGSASSQLPREAQRAS